MTGQRSHLKIAEVQTNTTTTEIKIRNVKHNSDSELKVSKKQNEGKCQLVSQPTVCASRKPNALISPWFCIFIE